MRCFALLSLAAALLRGSEQTRAVEETRAAVLSLLQGVVKPEAKAVAEPATTPAKAEASKAAPAPKAAAKEEPKAAPASAKADATPKAAPASAKADATPKAAPASAKADATPKAAPVSAKADPKVAAPKKVETKEHQQLVVDQLMKLASNLESNEKKIVEMDKDERKHAANSNITSMMKSDKDKEMWQNFDKWNHRMNEKTKVGSMDVISKIKHAVHFIKKGAMSGDKDAMAGLEDVIKSMGQMAR
jgi:hypothetical protein